MGLFGRLCSAGFRERAMLIVCPTCATTYQIKAGALGDAGRNVRCASCKNTWFATPESAVMEETMRLSGLRWPPTCSQIQFFHNRLSQPYSRRSANIA